MEIVEALRRWGGVATRAQLAGAGSRAAFEAALSCGEIVRVARGRYVAPGLDRDLATAHALTAVLSHESAALQHGWGVLLPPEKPHVSVSAHRRTTADPWREVVVHRAEWGPDDRSGAVTSQARTLVDCLRNLSFPRALAVADSALRAGRTPGWLGALARDAQGRGSGKVRRAAALATDLAANPFESGLRAITHEVPGLCMRPQVPIFGGSDFLGRPDLVDTDLEIVAEADSFEWHGGRGALVRDARRYNALAVHGWLVLRFTWEDVVLGPERVREVLAAAVDQRRKPRPRRRRAA